MKFEDVPGGFMPIDQAAFAWILQFQAETQPPGGLVELGVSRGKSAITLGSHRREGEVLTVCDDFDLEDAGEAADARIWPDTAPPTPRQLEFERNFLSFHRELPRIVRAPTTEITRHVAPESARFVHLDAGRTHGQVRAELEAAQTMLREGGVVALADYRKPDAMGIAAAAWEAILTGGLRPVINTDFKLYATWGDPAPLQAEIRRRADAAGWCRVSAPVMIRDLPMPYLSRKG